MCYHVPVLFKALIRLQVLVQYHFSIKPGSIFDSMLYTTSGVSLELLTMRSNIQLLRKRRLRLRMQVPVTLRNLRSNQHSHFLKGIKLGQQLTASGLIKASSFPPPNPLAFAASVLIPPSMTASATCTPCGPNSLARLCVMPRWANLPAAKEAKRAEPRREAVAPVTMRVGG